MFSICEPPPKLERKEPVALRAYRCSCGRPIFFRNSQCLGCDIPLGYEPRLGKVFALSPGPADGTWKFANAVEADEKCFRRCVNLESPAGCNWLVAAEDPHTLCISCRLNRTIPDLSVSGNNEKWRRIEIAKRRLVSSLLALGLTLASRLDEVPQRGLAFDFLQSLPQGPRVLTGYSNGIITLNIEEADDATRERIREEMNEPYRTVLGHLRHESGHYYWSQLIEGTSRIDAFHELFGDEHEDYSDALQRHRSEGPPPDWGQRYVSAYASAHPWEDWAETWTHYLHIVDTFDTALSFRLDIESGEMQIKPFTPDALYQPEEAGAASFLDFINSWNGLASLLNELSLSMGSNPFYPFVLSRSVVAKLHFIDTMVRHARVESGLQ